MFSNPTPHSPLTPPQEEKPELIRQLRGLIESARGQALRAVDSIQVRTCWEIGRHIMEFEQQGQDRATYGARLITKLAESLTSEFGKGFDERNLRHMRAFFQGFPIWNSARTELSWTHYRNLLRVENEQARNWYMDEAAMQIAPLQKNPHDFNCRVRHTHHSAYQFSANNPGMHLSQHSQLINL